MLSAFNSPETRKVFGLDAKDGLYQVDGGHFIAGLILKEGVVVKAAPIIRKLLLGRKKNELFGYCAGRHWKLERIAD